MKTKRTSKIKRRRVIALLTREEMEYLDKLGLDALFSTGSKLSRIDIIGALLDVAMELGISAKDIRNKKELAERILKAVQARPERRRYPRLKKNLVTAFRKMDSMEDYEYGMTEDISIGGFRIDVCKHGTAGAGMAAAAQAFHDTADIQAFIVAAADKHAFGPAAFLAALEQAESGVDIDDVAVHAHNQSQVVDVTVDSYPADAH